MNDLSIPTGSNRHTIPLIFVMGATNVGKTTFMDLCRDYDVFGLVEVGKMFRAKYPPDYFKGQAAPAHTQTEAWSMFLEGVKNAAEQGKQVAVIDGQPRNVEQTEWAFKMPNPKVFLHLWAPPDIREERARKRDAADAAKLDLSLKRLIDDPRVLFDCLTMIHLHVLSDQNRDVCFAYDTRTYVPYSALTACLEWLTGGEVRL